MGKFNEFLWKTDGRTKSKPIKYAPHFFRQSSLKAVTQS